MRRIKSWVFLLSLCTAFAPLDAVFGQVAVLVHEAAAIDGLSQKDLLDIYLGKTVLWEDKTKVNPLSLRSNHEATGHFFEKCLGKSLRTMKKKWIGLALSGQGAPPKSMDTEKEMVEYIADNRSAIGFVSLAYLEEAKLEGAIKVLAIEGKLPFEKGYMQQP